MWPILNPAIPAMQAVIVVNKKWLNDVIKQQIAMIASDVIANKEMTMFPSLSFISFTMAVEL